MGCGGFVRRPCEKVSAANKKLNSSLTNGTGIGRTRSTAARSPNGRRPQINTLVRRLLAIAPSRYSILVKKLEPRRGHRNANCSDMETNSVSKPVSLNIFRSSPRIANQRPAHRLRFFGDVPCGAHPGAFLRRKIRFSNPRSFILPFQQYTQIVVKNYLPVWIVLQNISQRLVGWKKDVMNLIFVKDRLRVVK